MKGKLNLFLTVLLAALTNSSLEGELIEAIAFGSCAKENREQPIWEPIIASEPDIWIWAGDNIYADTEDMDLFEEKYKQLKSQPGYQKLIETGIPILATWDDHDYGVNDGDRNYPMKREAQGLLLDFLGVKENSPRRNREGVYHSETYQLKGEKTLQVILLDTRYHRSELTLHPAEDGWRKGAYRPDSSREATILGEEQWDWLEDRLIEPADIRIIVSSIQFIAGEHRWEKWNNFPRERRKMLELIESTKAEGVVFLSGDRHHGEISMMDQMGLYPLYDLTASGLTQSRRPDPSAERRVSEQNRYRLGPIYRGQHFGLIQFHMESSNPFIELQLKSLEGKVVKEEIVYLNSLKFGSTIDNAPHILEMADRPKTNIQLDGRTADWPANVYAMHDPENIWIRFKASKERTLRNSDAQIWLGIDTDGSLQTGNLNKELKGSEWMAGFSIPNPERRWPRTLIQSFKNGEMVNLDREGLSFSPTHSSQWFEIKIDKSTLEGFSDQAAVTVIEKGTSETVKLMERQPFSKETLPASDNSKIEFPKKPEEALRVVAFNLLWGSQIKEPAAFARLLKTLDADILLFQEWGREQISEKEVTDWLSANVDGSIDWHASVSGIPGYWSGTLLASKHPILHNASSYTPVEDENWSFPARFAAAVIKSPIGDVLAASVHLKAGGYLDSREDFRRINEAIAINHLLRGMRYASDPAMVILGGDFNLVGTRDIMKVSSNMLDLDSSHLAVAETPVLGEPESEYTFVGGHPHPTLDYILYSEADTLQVNGFVVDTHQFNPDTLKRFNLKKNDTHVSDHLPVVVDLRLRKAHE